MTANKPRLNQYPENPLTIAAGEEYPIRRGGSFIRIRNASTTFKLRIDNDQILSMQENDVLRFREAPFKMVEVVNDSGGILTFQLEIGDGAVETNNVSISGDIKIAQGSTRAHSVASVGVAATLLLAANPARKGWKVVNNGTVPIFLGSDAGVTIANGEPLAVGAAAGWDDKDALYAISTVAAQDVRVTEIE